MRGLLAIALLWVAGCRTVDDSLGSPLQDAMGTRMLASGSIQSINYLPHPQTYPIWQKEAWTLTRLPSQPTSQGPEKPRLKSRHGAQTDPPLPPAEPER